MLFRSVSGKLGTAMTPAAIAMMTVACLGLWGGVAISLVIISKNNGEKRAMSGDRKETLREELQDYEEANINVPDRDE